MIRFMQTSAAFKKYALTAILVVICIAMAWYLVPSFSGQGLGISPIPTVATVAGQDVTIDEVQKTARRMIEQQFPRGSAQAGQLMPLFAGQAYQQLVNQKVMLVEARRMGLKATDDDVRGYLHQGDLGQELFPNGQFVGQAAYEDFASRAGYTIPQLEQAVKDQVLMDKLRALVTAGATVTESDIRQAFEKQNTKVKFDYAIIKKDDILKTVKPTDAELKAFYERNKQTYVNSIPEKRQLKYVVIDNARLMAQTQVTQQDLERYYDQHRDEYRVPGQVNVRQIVIKKPLPGSDGKVDQKALEAARAKAQDVARQVKAGGNFADLAKKYSEDTDTAKNGGSLGAVRPDVFPDASVRNAVTSTPKGQSSDLIDAGYAFVLIHVDDREEAHVKTLEDVKAQIEPLIKQQKAADAAQHEADQVLADARNSGLEKAAAAQGLQVITTDFVTSKDTLPGIGNDPQFMNAAFSQTEKAPPDEAGLHSGYAIYQVTAVKPPSTPTFEEARSRVEQEFKNQRAAQLLEQKTQELSDRAKADHDLKKAAKESGAEFKTSEFVLPDAQVPDIGSMTGPAKVAFTLKPGEISGPIDSGNTGAVLSVIDRQAPTEQDYTAKKDQIREGLVQEKQQEAFMLFLGNLVDKMKADGKIRVNQKEYEALTRPRSEEE
ncbi:MAG TPA: peptidyl-prolyl cis-trans isomerase [Terriglobales bacterium]